MALISASVILLGELGIPLPYTIQNIATAVFQIFGLAFMWLGLVLLVTAVGRLRQAWPKVSPSARLVCVLGLAIGTFVGAYIFHLVFPNVPEGQHQ